MLAEYCQLDRSVQKLKGEPVAPRCPRNLRIRDDDDSSCTTFISFSTVRLCFFKDSSLLSASFVLFFFQNCSYTLQNPTLCYNSVLHLFGFPAPSSTHLCSVIVTRERIRDEDDSACTSFISFSGVHYAPLFSSQILPCFHFFCLVFFLQNFNYS